MQEKGTRLKIEHLTQAAVRGNSTEFFKLAIKYNTSQSELNRYVRYCLRHGNVDLLEDILKATKSDIDLGPGYYTERLSTNGLLKILEDRTDKHRNINRNEYFLGKLCSRLSIQRTHGGRLIRTIESMRTKEHKNDLLDHALEQVKDQSTNSRKEIYQSLSVFLREDYLSELLEGLENE